MSVPETPVWSPEEYRKKPRDRTAALVDEVLLRVSNGETLLGVCRDLHMPLPSTWLDWCEEDKQLTERFDRALRRSVEVRFDMVSELSMQADTMRARVQSEAAKWRVERQLPEKYGPRAIVKQASDADTGGGIDHAADVRRRIEDMALRSTAPG